MILDIGLAVRLVVSVRSHTSQAHGCPEWEGPGVQAALIATEGAPGVVLAAMLLAASDPKLDKPSANAVRMHWPKNAGIAQPAPRHNVRCVDHTEFDMPCPHPDHHGSMTADEIAAAKAECIRLAEEARTTPAVPRREPAPLTEPADRLDRVRALIPDEETPDDARQ